MMDRHDLGPFVREEDGDGLDEDRGMEMLTIVICLMIVVAVIVIALRYGLLDLVWLR